MKLTFNDLYYDELKDQPVAVLSNENGQSYYVVVSCNMAENLINMSLKSAGAHFMLQELLIDLIVRGEVEIIGIFLHSQEEGRLVVAYNGEKKEYLLTNEEAILYSSLLHTFIEADDAVASTFLTKENYFTEYQEYDTRALN